MIKEKLSSRSGTTMLLALIYLLLCVVIGGSVLAGATANAGRAKNLQLEQQRYLSQRSAMLLMAERLKGMESLTVKDVTVTDGDGSVRTVTYTIQGETQKSVFQKLLYEYAVYQYLSTPGGNPTQEFVNFYFTDMEAGERYHYNAPAANSESFDISVSVDAQQEQLQAVYAISEKCDFQITFANEGDTGMTLTMNAYSSKEETVTMTVNGVTTVTKTSIIGWEDPIISKGAAST